VEKVILIWSELREKNGKQKPFVEFGNKNKIGKLKVSTGADT
jgi:hypothetical protein